MLAVVTIAEHTVKSLKRVFFQAALNYEASAEDERRPSITGVHPGKTHCSPISYGQDECDCGPNMTRCFSGLICKSHRCCSLRKFFISLGLPPTLTQTR